MLSPFEQLDTILSTCQHSKVGKLLPDALYVHVSALKSLDPLLQSYESAAREIASRSEGITLVKFSLEKPSISYLSYPEFDSDPHPALQLSISERGTGTEFSGIAVSIAGQCSASSTGE
jgi:DNA phosphorothioation-associated putative methyltransferase